MNLITKLKQMEGKTIERVAEIVAYDQVGIVFTDGNYTIIDATEYNDGNACVTLEQDVDKYSLFKMGIISEDEYLLLTSN